MGLGVLSDSKLEHVPGTVFLNEAGISGLDLATGGKEALEATAGLKHENNIVLVPQPSDSPQDPLNWTRWKKELFSATFTFGMGVVGAVGPLLSTATVPLAKSWGTSIATFVHSYNSVLLGSLAFGSIFNNAIAIKYGKRPVLLANSVLLAAGNFWGGAAGSLGSMTGSRAMTGFGLGPWEALIPASIADIWCVHQRGFRIGLFNLGLIAGLNLVLAISAPIITNYGWRVANYGMGGAWLLVALLVLFFMPESTYIRANTLNLDTTSKENLPTVVKDRRAEHVEESLDTEKLEFQETITQTTTNKTVDNVTFRSQYMLWSGRCYDQDNLLAIMLRPFRMALSPSVAWGAIIYSAGIAWLVLLGVTVSQIFSPPPYNFTVIQVGLAKLAAFVASVLGAIVAHPLSDGVAVYMARRNRGIYEPEFRLPLVLSFLLFTTVGFMAFGKAAQAGESWPVPVVIGLGFINFGVQLTCTGATAYVVDCHREDTLATFALLSFCKCVLSMGLTFCINDWIISSGVTNVFYTLGGITAGLTLTTLPIYMFGKRLRSWYHRHIPPCHDKS